MAKDELGRGTGWVVDVQVGEDDNDRTRKSYGVLHGCPRIGSHVSAEHSYGSSNLVVS